MAEGAAASVARRLRNPLAALALAQLALPPAALTQSSWRDFPAFVWRHEHAGREAPLELLALFGGTNVEGAEEAAWARARGLAFYVGHAPGRDDLHLDRDSPRWLPRWERWYETRDEGLLVREPCLSDPVTERRLDERLERSLCARGGDVGLGVSLGDEVGLTPNGAPSDVCRSPACEAAWRRFLAREGLPYEEAPTTDAARLALTDGDTSLLELWLARRRFHQEVVLALLARLADRTRELAPGAPVGLLGLAGQSAFGGVALERALAFRL